MSMFLAIKTIHNKADKRSYTLSIGLTSGVEIVGKVLNCEHNTFLTLETTKVVPGFIVGTVFYISYDKIVYAVPKWL